MLSPVKLVSSESGENYAQIKHHLSVTTVQNTCKQIYRWILMWEEKTGRSVIRYYVFLILPEAIYFYFLSSKFRFSFQNTLIAGLSWITWGLLWCFYQLFRLSFWRHPFTAVNSMHYWESDIIHDFSKSLLMKKQTHLHVGWPEGEYIFQFTHIW